MRGRGTTLGGRYTLTERIGGGGMGAVWRADDEVLARQVAVKILHPALLADGTFATRFRREAQLLAALSHPGIVDVHDYGESGAGPESGEGAEEDRVAYIVMELVDGRPLDEALAESGPMPAERALGLLAKALDALHAAHQRGIVHRDLKPSNLMLRDRDQVTVTDFGIARALASTKITASHEVLGTALYMAPEQAEGATVTPACDLYSIGVVCYELLTGERPFTGDSVLEVALKHIREPAPELPAVFPPAVRGFVATALAKQPEDRFADAAAMAAAARAAIGAGPAPAPRPAADDTDRAEPKPEPKPESRPEAEPKPESRPEAEPKPESRPEAEPKVESRAVPERPRRRSRRALLVPVIIPVVITAGASTVLFIDRPLHRSEANALAPQPSGAPPGTAGAGAGTPQATPPTSGPSPSGPSPSAAGPTAPPQSGTAPGAVGRPPNTPPDAGNPGTPPPGGRTTAPQAPPASKPAPGASTQKPSKPPGCGGTDWGYIVNVGDGLRLGLAKNTLAGGTAVVTGGATAYGWVHSVPSSWHQFNPCNMGSPALVQETDGRVSLSNGFSYLANWTVAPATTRGAYYLQDYMGSLCLTDNGAGKQVTMVTCTPGNKAQEWRVP
ncbi:protein kinase [Streptomyces sp. NPDC051211]|uniref:serine/threonine-protein kinase n=1 Tax=Streptomyces sp. NPDC051211 TaxID=3154643 RepID=UPI00344C3382